MKAARVVGIALEVAHMRAAEYGVLDTAAGVLVAVLADHLCGPHSTGCPADLLRDCILQEKDQLGHTSSTYCSQRQRVSLQQKTVALCPLCPLCHPCHPGQAPVHAGRQGVQQDRACGTQRIARCAAPACTPQAQRTGTAASACHPRCMKSPGSCLDNQIDDLRAEDPALN
eukprot:gene7395-biopygen5953